jgi:DNA-binding NarL/FixJ family response regulator
MIKVGLADHQLYFRRGVLEALGKEKGIRTLWDVAEVQDLVQALHRSTPDILLVGLNLKGFDFLSFIEQKKIRYPLLKVIVLSSSDDLSQSKELLDAGVNAILPRESEDDVAAAAILAVAENDIFFNELVSRALLTRLRRIFLSVKSVENIRYHLKIKAGVSSSISLVAYALRNRLIR